MGVIAQICKGSASSGFPILSSGPVSWSLTEGTTPVTQVFHLTPAHKKEILDWSQQSAGNSISLRIKTGNKEVFFRQLFCLGAAGGPNPFVNAITVADRRFFWSYCHIGPRRYNWRRIGGVKRLPNPGVEANFNAPFTEKIYYNYNSLKKAEDGEGYLSTSAWDAPSVLKSVLGSVFEFEKDQREMEEAPVMPSLPPIGDIPIENLQVDDAGDQAINKILGYMPGLAIYLDHDGRAQLKLKNSGAEKHTAGVDVLGAEKVDKGHISMIHNTLVRPRKIHVQFERQCEVRFDYWENPNNPSGVDPSSGAVDDAAAQAVEFSNKRWMKNVLINPDFDNMGNYYDFTYALNLWDNLPKPNGVNLKFTFDLVQKAMVPFMDIWAGLRQLGMYDPDNNWMARISAVQQHYRQTFQINTLWNEASYNMQAARVAIVDSVTGKQSPALALANHTRLGSQKSFRMNLLDSEDLEYAMPIFCYPADNWEYAGDKMEDAGPPANEKYPIQANINPLFHKTQPLVRAPIQTTVLDQDQGVLHFSFLPDVTRNYEQMLPSLLTMSVNKNNNGPGANPTHRDRPITFDMVSKTNLENFPQLSKYHRALVIVTLSPSGWSQSEEGSSYGKPYENRQLETITIDPNGAEAEKLKSKLSPECQKTFQNTSGPDMYIRVGGGTEVARIAWRDDLWQETEKIFGMRAGEIDTSELCINRDNSISGASLNDIALSTAARVYESLTDRYQGDKTSTLAPLALPLGHISSVGYSVAPSGEVSTRVDLPESIEQLDLLSFLDSSTRAVILKLSDLNSLK
jgi:hypothetical protein